MQVGWQELDSQGPIKSLALNPTPEFAIVELDLPSKFFVVLQGRGVREVKILRSAKDFKDLSEASVGPVFVGHGFPSETEAKVYIAGAGRASTLGI